MTPRLPLAALPRKVDVLIVGGGITGAGVFAEATRAGLRTMLVEARDYASGTSSWSSKLVHGGLRYLATGEWRLTQESVRERQRLLRELPDLVQPMAFHLPICPGKKPSKLSLRLGLWLYDHFAQQHMRSHWQTAAAAQAAIPTLAPVGLRGAMVYTDARTDDCRLVMALLAEGQAQGGICRNYTRVQALLHTSGAASGAAISDEQSGEVCEIQARVVVNATGVWAGSLPKQSGKVPGLRPLKGSHLVFPAVQLPLPAAVSWMHPKDNRPIFAYPWQGATLVGTTDLDYGDYLADPVMQADECAYLLDGLGAVFPQLQLGAEQAIASFAGVRPVVDDGAASPSAASRESAFWAAPGLVGITGGKLTTFRVAARQVLAEIARQIPSIRPVPEDAALFALEHRGHAPNLAPDYDRLMLGAPEHCVYLDDLMLRRTRTGLVLPGFGERLLDEATECLQRELRWDSQRAKSEQIRYRHHMQAQHRVPIPT